MDPIFMHLRVNHFPIVLIVVGAVACAVAAATGRERIWTYGLVTTLIAGLSGPVAYWTGLRADDKASEFEVLDLGAMADHESSALWAMIALVVAAVAAGVALARPKPALRWIVLALAVVAAGLCGWTGSQAGQIAHGEFTMGQ